ETVGPDLVVNGSFEANVASLTGSPLLSWGGLSYSFLNVGLGPAEAALAGWTETGNGVNVHTHGPGLGPALYPIVDGNYNVDLNEAAAGGIVQTLATVPGTAYRLEFLASGADKTLFDPHAGGASPAQVAAIPALFEARVQFGALDEHLALAAPATGQLVDWMTFTFDMVATAATTELRFTSLNGSVTGLQLDDVRVRALAAVPLPAAGMLLLSALGLGAVPRLAPRRGEPA
ncbi:MAG: DUF642 domain-containing protein, partial [Gammaproteobacteria bacterium]|nr:DUF642 domain-containing protein [Gammaproteobacteria bacterium]